MKTDVSRLALFAQAAAAQGRWAEAESHLAALVGHAPGDADAWSNLGLMRLRLGRRDAALDALLKAVECNPRLAPAHMNLATLLLSAGRLRDAEKHARKAVRLSPQSAVAAKILGDVLLRLEQNAEAERELRRALSLDANGVEAWNSLSSLLKRRGKLDEAIAACRRSLAVRYNDTAARNLVMALTYDPTCGLDDLFAAQSDWARHQQGPALPAVAALDRSPDRVLRIGFVSADLRQHSVARNLIDLFQARDPAAVGFYAYSLSPATDDTSRRLAACCAEFRMVGHLDNRGIAEQIRADAIDIAVHVGCWTGENRPGIAVYKPAPIQISMHGLGSSGLAEMDYWLTDSVLHPPDRTRERFSETLLRLPCFYLHQPPADAPEPGALPALSSGRITFASFNHPAKLSDRTLALWGRIMTEIPHSDLLLHYGDGFKDPVLRRHVLDHLGRCGISKSRIRFHQNRLDTGAHLSLYGQADVALDCHPFNGSTTTFEALYMGVPVLTLVGDRFLSRCAWSFLCRCGLAELGGETEDQVVAAARNLVADLPALARLRAQLRGRLEASPILDAPAYAKAFEAAMRRAWLEKVAAPG